MKKFLAFPPPPHGENDPQKEKKGLPHGEKAPVRRKMYHT